MKGAGNTDAAHLAIANRLIAELNKEFSLLKAKGSADGRSIVASAAIAAAATYAVFNVTYGYEAMLRDEDVEYLSAQFAERMRETAASFVDDAPIPLYRRDTAAKSK